MSKIDSNMNFLNVIQTTSLRLISSVLKVHFLVWNSRKILFSIDKDERKNLIIGGQKAVLVQ